MARVMPKPAEKNRSRPLTHSVKKSKDEAVQTVVHVWRMAQGATLRIIPSNHSEPRRRWRWKTLVHRITTARRATGRLLVSHASRLSIGCRLPA